MAKVTGREGVKRYMAAIPEFCRTKLLPGAARAGAKVIADEAKSRCQSQLVADDIIIRAKREDDRVRVKVTVRHGWSYSIGVWLEYGTAPHFISVDESQRRGRSVSTINRRQKGGSLAINGKPIGATVYHPGARPHPFLRPALDIKKTEAIRAAQNYITTRLKRTGLTGSDETDEDA